LVGNKYYADESGEEQVGGTGYGRVNGEIRRLKV